MHKSLMLLALATLSITVSGCCLFRGNDASCAPAPAPTCGTSYGSPSPVYSAPVYTGPAQPTQVTQP